jgi:hypothetical protein
LQRIRLPCKNWFIMFEVKWSTLLELFSQHHLSLVSLRFRICIVLIITGFCSIQFIILFLTQSVSLFGLHHYQFVLKVHLHFLFNLLSCGLYSIAMSVREDSHWLNIHSVIIFIFVSQLPLRINFLNVVSHLVDLFLFLFVFLSIFLFLLDVYFLYFILLCDHFIELHFLFSHFFVLNRLKVLLE